MFFLVTNEAGREFDDGVLHGDPELFDEDDFLLRGDGEDADAGIGVGTSHELPMIDAVDGEPAGLEECLSHGGSVRVLVG